VLTGSSTFGTYSASSGAGFVNWTTGPVTGTSTVVFSSTTPGPGSAPVFTGTGTYPTNTETAGVLAQAAIVGVTAVPAVPAIPAVPVNMSTTQFLVYKQYTGNAAFDALFSTTTDAGNFMPYIPMILNTNQISSTYLPTVYAQSQIAVQKALGTTVTFDDLMAKVQVNPSLSSISYAYIVFGVSLNVLENTCRDYIYQFFLSIMQGEVTSSTAFAAWQTAWAAAATAMTAWETWQVGGSVGPAPAILAYPQSPRTSISVTSSNPTMDYSMTISWDNCAETVGTGQLTTDLGNLAQTGDFWFETVSNYAVPIPAWVNNSGLASGSQTQTHIRLNWQVDTNNWRCLDIYNLEHANLIYGGNGVITTAAQALASATESGFIIPLNTTIYKNMPLPTSTQMATACCFIVFNSYTVTTTPWYESGWFAVLIIIAFIAVSVFTVGGGAIGLLGTSLAVGTAVGFTGLTAIIVGAAVNALAAIVLISLIQKGATALFGPQLGAIIGAIVGLIALQVGSAMASGMSASDLLGQMLQPMNLLKLTEAAGNGYAQVMQLQAQATNASTQAMLATYNTASAKLEAQSVEMFGSGGGAANLDINPMSLTDYQAPSTTTNPLGTQLLIESPQTFFDRTLMVGTDICNLSSAYINNFCTANLDTTLVGFDA